MLVMLVASTAGWLFIYVYFICWGLLSSLLLSPFTLLGHACAACCHRVKPLVDCPFFMNWSLLASLLFSIIVLCCHCHHWPSIACLCCLLLLSLPVDCPFFIISIIVFALSMSPSVIIVAAILIETAALVATIIVTCCCGHSCVLLRLVLTCIFCSEVHEALFISEEQDSFTF